MKKPIVIAFLLSLLSIFPLSGQTDISILQRMVENQSDYRRFFSLPYGNPAMKYGMYEYTLNEISAGGEYRHENQPLIIQTGDGYRYGLVDVKSFIRKKQSSMWGEASYRNGKQMNLKWNETSDYLLLYPYVIGDTIGGNLKSEQYVFNGGYTAQTGKLILGADASYHATIGYRQVDPRPRNITGKLDFTFGIALANVKGYRPGISINASKYKQKNDIKFYNEQGNPTLYHFTGLGTDYYRFRGKEKETYYKGRIFGGSINLLPETGNGFTANISFNNFMFEKIISALNELPMAKVDEYTWKAEAGYKQKFLYRTWGVKAEFINKHRKGTENIFGDPVNDIYPQIASAQQYSNKHMGFLISGFFENTNPENIIWAIRPTIGLNDIDTRYIYPARKSESERLYSTLFLQAGKKTGKCFFRLMADICYDASLNANLQLPDDTDSRMSVPLLNNYRFLASDHTLMKLQLRSDYAINRRCALYLSAYWQRGWYTKQVRTDNVSVVLGVAF